MNETENENCQWKDCVLPASKRVDFSRRYFAIDPRPPEQLDLCNVHAWKIRKTYRDYNDCEIIYNADVQANS